MDAALLSSRRRNRWVTQTRFVRQPTPLAVNMAGGVDARINDKSAASALAVFTTITHDDAGPFVRNTGFYGAALDFTCVSPSNSDRDGICAGTLITRRHLLFTNHGGEGVGFPTTGSTMRFVAADNSIVLRTLDQHTLVTGTDLRLGLLSEDVPVSITPCSVAPDTLGTWLPQSGLNTPVVVFDQEEKALVHELSGWSTGMIYFKEPSTAKRRAFYELVIAGDSGDPVFAIINGVPVLFGLLTTEVSGNSPAGHNTAINTAIGVVDAAGSVSTGYTVTNPTLTGF